ncbi:hypothetical protein TSUD_26000 [Trifolium subterraneum]|uniref:Uncharacterized protein n=1 Tax=Trifolium subterraneum TaxID=3900 RepID=A0A2Z6NXC0_TRISU|nr:hypothetical protein TSUD_26000 [Trifolium subterraneum]
MPMRGFNNILNNIVLNLSRSSCNPFRVLILSAPTALAAVVVTFVALVGVFWLLQQVPVVSPTPAANRSFAQALLNKDDVPYPPSETMYERQFSCNQDIRGSVSVRLVNKGETTTSPDEARKNQDDLDKEMEDENSSHDESMRLDSPVYNDAAQTFQDLEHSNADDVTISGHQEPTPKATYMPHLIMDPPSVSSKEIGSVGVSASEVAETEVLPSFGLMFLKIWRNLLMKANTQKLFQKKQKNTK